VTGTAIAARRATFITRSIWVLAHLLILAAILSAPSQIHQAILEGDSLPILLALILIGLNVWLYAWVSVSNPGVVTAESNAKRAARVSQQAAANTATTTAAQLARNTGNRPDPLAASAAPNSISSMGASSAVSGNVGGKGAGFASPACVASASPSTNTPTSAFLTCFCDGCSPHICLLCPHTEEVNWQQNHWHQLFYVLVCCLWPKCIHTWLCRRMSLAR
jgi:hypothetical protein